jgi:hypothetical protein
MTAAAVTASTLRATRAWAISIRYVINLSLSATVLDPPDIWLRRWSAQAPLVCLDAQKKARA